MNCRTVSDVLDGTRLEEEAGGLSALRAHAGVCDSCRASLAGFWSENARIREGTAAALAGDVLRSAGRRRWRTRLAGWSAGWAASVLAACLATALLSGRADRPAWRIDRGGALFEKPGCVVARLVSGSAHVRDSGRLELRQGRLDVSVVPGSGPFEVVTPAGTVRVVGTEFRVSVESEKEGVLAMNPLFWKGVGAGVITTVAVWTGKVVLSGAGGQSEVRAGEIASVRAGAAPGAARSMAETLDASQKELASAREALAAERNRAAEMKARADQLQAVLLQVSEESDGLRDKVSGILAKAGKDGPKPAAERLRQSLRVGAALTEDASSWLGLDPSQRDALDALLKEEGKRLYDHVRRTATASGRGAVPAQDGAELFLNAITPLLEETAKLRDLVGDPEVADGRKTVYLEDALGPDSAFVRFCDAVTSIRRETLDSADRILTDEQRSKL